MQWPPWHFCPATQLGLAPHAHPPLAQVSLSARSQVRHLPPLVPQALGSFTAQKLPLQQPLGQLLESQTQAPLTQCWPSAQGPPVAPHWQTPL